MISIVFCFCFACCLLAERCRKGEVSNADFAQPIRSNQLDPWLQHVSTYNGRQRFVMLSVLATPRFRQHKWVPLWICFIRLPLCFCRKAIRKVHRSIRFNLIQSLCSLESVPGAQAAQSAGCRLQRQRGFRMKYCLGNTDSKC